MYFRKIKKKIKILKIKFIFNGIIENFTII